MRRGEWQLSDFLWKAYSVGGRIADIVLVEAGEVNDIEAQRLDSGHSGNKVAIIITGCLQIQAALWAICGKSGWLHINADLAQVATDLAEPIDVGPEVVIVSAQCET